MKNKLKKIFINNKGFTLLEVLISVSIIAFAFITLLKLNTSNLITVHYSGIATNLNFLVKQRISEHEMTDYPELGTTTGEFENSPGYSWEETVSNFGVDGVRRIEISVIAPDGHQKNNVTFYKAR